MLQLKHRIISSLILLILDFLWLGGFMGKRYSIMIPKIQGSKMEPNMLYAFFSYLLMLIGLNVFVLPNLNIKNINIKDCLKYGFLFGIVLYGVYDFTTATVIKNWNIKLALVDVLWGGIVYFLACYGLRFINLF